MKIELKEELKKSIQKEVIKLMAEEISKEDSFQQMKKEMMAELFKVETSSEVPAEPKKPERPRTLNSRLGWDPINKQEEKVKKILGVLYNPNDLQRGFTGDEMTKEEEKFMFESAVTKKGMVRELEQKIKELESQLKNYESENYSIADEASKVNVGDFKFKPFVPGVNAEDIIPVMPKPINRIHLDSFEPFDFSTAKEKLQAFKNKAYGTSLDPAIKGLEDLENKLNESHSKFIKSEYSESYLNNLNGFISGITLTGTTIDLHTERVLPPSASTVSGTTESPSGSIAIVEKKPRRKRRVILKKEKKKPAKRLKTAAGKTKKTLVKNKKKR